MKFILLFLSLVSVLFANPAVTENDPSTLVNGVSMITGDLYTFDEDLVVAGAEPIHLRRGYLSSAGDWMPDAHLKAQLEVLQDFFVAQEANGTMIYYRVPPPTSKEKKKGTHKPIRCPSILAQSPGVTNTASGHISAKTNYQNQYLVIETDKKTVTIHGANGTKRRYRANHNQKPVNTGIGYQHLHYLYHLRSEELPNGNTIEYKWDHQNNLTSIVSKSPRDIPYASLTFPEVSDKKPLKSRKILGSDHQSVNYEYHYVGAENKEYIMLKAVDPPDEPKRQFCHNLKKFHRGSAKIEQPYLEKISLSNGREVFIEYEKWKDKLLESHFRVKKLRSPIGSNQIPLVSHTFFYFPDDRNSYVIDAQGNKTAYYWNDDKRLTRIDSYEGTDRLHHSEKFTWEGTNIRCKSLFDQNQKPISARTFEYDSRGNVTSEIFLGQLSGRSPPLQIDAHGYYIENGVDRCIKKTTYTNDGKDLPIRQEESSGLITLYEYYPNTHLLKTKILCDQGNAQIYHHYQYNEDHILVREITDDGLTKTIRQITPKQQAPYYGMPEVIEEKYDQHGHEILLSKTILHYGAGGKVIRKDIHDANNAYRYSLHYSYDSKGRLERETNPLGWESITRYDGIGNRIYSRDTSGLETFYDYDASNRLIKKEEVGCDPIRNVFTYQYDRNHNLISETDAKGHTTRYTLTPLGKRIQTHLSPIPTETGTLVTPILQSSFDSAGNETSFTDADGFSTHTEYNAYGKPICTHHPNGAQETWTYNLDGTLRSHIDPTGVLTAYTHDYLGRVLRKTISHNNTLLAEESTQYHGLHLIAKTDAEGNQTTFAYDRAGRKISETYANETTTFQYDEFSRNHRIEQGTIRTVHQFNLLGQIEQTREEEIPTNQLLRTVVYHYDRAGNKIATFRWIHENRTEIHDRCEYDSQKRLISKTDPSGHRETISYNDYHINQHNQKVLQKTHTDPMGLQTIDTFDTHGRIVKTQKYQNGTTLSVEDQFFNARGKTTFQINTAFASNSASRSIRTRWEYDAAGRPITLIEADGTSDAKVTSYTYTLRGEKQTTTKPDGTLLTFTYTPLGHLEQLTSSDQTVNHHMRYDRLGNLIWHDGIERIVDPRGRLLEEHFPNYRIQNSYNHMGERLTCSCPEADFLIEYAYLGKDMTHVTRKTIDGRTLYIHQYLAHDLYGNLQGALLPNNLGQIRFQYDLNSRKESIESPSYRQQVLETDKLGNIFHLTTQDQHSHFTYDELYQLTSESGLFNHTYQHDSLYCRLTKDDERYQINALNQIASHIAYDKNGNSLQHGDIKYAWDALDRLIRIQTPDALQTFTYDSQHRRLSAVTRSCQGEETTDYFLYDGQNEIGSFNVNLQIQALRVLGSTPHAEIGAAVGIELGKQIYAPIHDLSGNITQLLPIDGTEPIETHYSAFGEETGSRLCPWRFSSKRVDEKTDLVYFGRRFYQKELGRWLSPDPAGFTDGMNLYAFVHNAPLTHLDEYGLLDFGQWDKTPQQRLDEQRGMIWGASRWARSFTSSAIHTAAFVSQTVLPWPLGFSNQIADRFARSINRSISRCTGYIAPYQFGNADFNRGKQIGYYGSEALSLALLAPTALKLAGDAWRAFSHIVVSNERAILNFTNTAGKHMFEVERRIPMHILDKVVKSPMTVVKDPRGASTAMMHYSQIWKNGKLYNVEVLYDKTTNTISHFRYGRDPMGSLKKIPKPSE